MQETENGLEKDENEDDDADDGMMVVERHMN